jgi:hypothetical protein
MGYHARWDTVPHGIPCRAGYHAVRDTGYHPRGLPRRVLRRPWRRGRARTAAPARRSASPRSGTAARTSRATTLQARAPLRVRACVRARTCACVSPSVRACVLACVRALVRAGACVCACAPASVRMNACARPCACRCGRVPASAHVGVNAPASALARKCVRYARARRKRAGGRVTTARACAREYAASCVENPPPWCTRRRVPAPRQRRALRVRRRARARAVVLAQARLAPALNHGTGPPARTLRHFRLSVPLAPVFGTLSSCFPYP